MGRLCERPGCSEVAALAYGMRPEDLVFWIEALREGEIVESGVLCQRHADSMTVPRGWTLDDLREPDLHLFRPPPRPDGPAHNRNRPRRRSSSDDTGQLAFGGLADDLDDLDDPDEESELDDNEVAQESPEEAAEPTPREITPPGATPSGALAWKPAFDDGDDLDGLLAASSPLLSRAFRGQRGN